MPKRRIVHAVVALAVLALLAGCSSKQREPSGFMDTPGHHFAMGLRLLDRGDVPQAGREFDLALGLDKKYPPALAGKGLVAALNGDRDSALDLLDDALDEADDLDEDEAPEDLRAWPAVMGIRIWTALHQGGQADGDDLLDETGDLLDEALDIHEESAAARFYAGEAHAVVLDFDRAEELYAQVLDLNRDYVDQARERWKLLQDARRVSPGSAAGRRIALVGEITRADMAALLTEEIDVARFYEATPLPAKAQTFTSPKAPVNYYHSDPYDVRDHPLASSITEVLDYGVKGLEPYSDGSFRPDETLTRAEAAMIYEDVLVRATGDWSLATRFIGKQSPFRDLGGDHAAFNAAMLATTRGLMKADTRSGRFMPGGTVSGVEALSALQALKADLRLFR